MALMAASRSMKLFGCVRHVGRVALSSHAVPYIDPARHRMYEDRLDVPMPTVPYIEDLTADQRALKTKEEGDWKNLSVDEKKGLYRIEYLKTFTEIVTPTGEWKVVIGGVLWMIAGCGVVFYLQRKYVSPDMPRTMNAEWVAATQQRMVDVRNQPISGLPNKYDYDSKSWK